MARKHHGGLGRGLDALIPQARRSDPLQNDSGNRIREETKNDNTDKPAVKTDPEHSVTEKAVEDRPGSGDFSGQTEGSERQGEVNKEDQGQVRMLRLSQVDPNRSQPRTRFEEEALEELAESIRQFGVLQPILVQKKNGRYEIIAGERRWRASRKAGLTEIPAIVCEYSNQEAVELSLIENIQREDLNPIEEARAFKRLLDEFGLRQEDLAVRVSKSRTAITNSIRLLKLDERVQEMVVNEKISMGHARALIPVEIPEEQFLLAQQIEEKRLSVRDTEKLVKNLGADKKKKADKKKEKKERDPALDLAYKAIEERLKQSLGTKASIRHGGDGTGKIEIEFYSHEDLEKIVDLLT